MGGCHGDGRIHTTSFDLLQLQLAPDHEQLTFAPFCQPLLLDRFPSYRITVQSNGQLLIGSAYTKQLGLNPGDEFEISLGRKHIRLNHLSPEKDQAVDSAA